VQNLPHSSTEAFVGRGLAYVTLHTEEDGLEAAGEVDLIHRVILLLHLTVD